MPTNIYTLPRIPDDPRIEAADSDDDDDGMTQREIRDRELKADQLRDENISSYAD